MNWHVIPLYHPNRRCSGDWQQTGRALAEEWRKGLRHPANAEWHLYNFWEDLVIAAARGNPSGLVERIQSQALTFADRKILATVLERHFKSKPRKGRRRKHAVRNLAGLAHQFYAEWKYNNRLNGVPDRGHSAAMKDEACRQAIAIHPAPGRPVRFDEVRELMDRPRSRRY